MEGLRGEVAQGGGTEDTGGSMAGAGRGARASGAHLVHVVPSAETGNLEVQGTGPAHTVRIYQQAETSVAEGVGTVEPRAWLAGKQNGAAAVKQSGESSKLKHTIQKPPFWVHTPRNRVSETEVRTCPQQHYLEQPHGRSSRVPVDGWDEGETWSVHTMGHHPLSRLIKGGSADVPKP